MAGASVIPALTSPFRLRIPHSIMTTLPSANFSEQGILMVFRLNDLYVMLVESADLQDGRQWRGTNNASHAEHAEYLMESGPYFREDYVSPKIQWHSGSGRKTWIINGLFTAHNSRDAHLYAGYATRWLTPSKSSIFFESGDEARVQDARQTQISRYHELRHAVPQNSQPCREQQ